MESRPIQVVPGEAKTAAVTFSFEATRRIGYFIGKVIVPLILIVAMSWIVFWIDPKQAASQISVAITAMLTLIAYRFVLSGLLPRLPYMTTMDYFILASTLLVFLGLVLVISMSSLVRNNQDRLARHVEFVARLAFPVFFVIVLWWFLLGS